ncbi:MAG: hypothetical protein QOF83_393 [Solirubrobacteraceae bacterium]|jgi:hypothetical protein|nr:hypothetical protein [Solirubrobacteraceae bacterium]
MYARHRRLIFALLSAVAIAMTSTSLALAATPPTATTAPATNITSNSATLNGAVAPNQTTTTYHFEYGTSTTYASKTPAATANGNSTKTVSADVTGLAGNTKYHYRLVATSAGGTSNGSDQTFTTSATGTPIPTKNSVSISSAPHTIVWGRTTHVSGMVSGPGKAGKTVVLKANPYPYTGAFTPTGQTTTTTSTGAYAFTVAPGKNTRYQVTVATKPPVTSGSAGVGVHVKVAIHVSTLRPFRGHLVRFFGTVTPAHNGRFAQIQRRTSTGAWRTVASTRLVAGGIVNGVAVSRYSKKIRVRFSGTYRVRVNPRDGNHLVGNSATRHERVR